VGATPVCLITAAGIQRPDFATVLNYFQTLFRSLYGEDVYLGADCQDGQFMTLLANALHDANGETEAAYFAYSPSTAIGVGLSSVVKINGIQRKAASYSTCDFLIVGQVGTSVTGGIVRDADGNQWALNSFIIPAAGQLTVSGVCQTLGAVTLAAGGISTAASKGGIVNPQLGWQSAANLADAVPGQPVETDSQLRQRQTLSTALPAQTILESMLGVLYAVAGVTRIRAYENDTNIQDPVTGAPGHTLTFVIEGGDPAVLGAIIAAKKGIVGTYGSVLVPLQDAYGIPHPVRFFRPVALPIAWNVSVRPKAGYTLDVAAAIQASLAAYTGTVLIGGNQELAPAYAAAGLAGDPRSATFEVVSLKALRRNGGADNYGDVQAAFNEAPICNPGDVVITPVLI
jgi:hypothetical protein